MERKQSSVTKVTKLAKCSEVAWRSSPNVSGRTKVVDKYTQVTNGADVTNEWTSNRERAAVVVATSYEWTSTTLSRSCRHWVVGGSSAFCDGVFLDHNSDILKIAVKAVTKTAFSADVLSAWIIVVKALSLTKDRTRVAERRPQAISSCSR